jgi:hypothetical protein
LSIFEDVAGEKPVGTRTHSEFLPSVANSQGEEAEVNKKMTNFKGPVGSSEEGWIPGIVSANGDNLLPEVDLRSRIDYRFRLAIPDATEACGTGSWGPQI